MSFSSRQRRLRLFFEKIFEDDYELDVYHADRILKCLEDTSFCGLQNKLLDSSFFSDILLITYSVQKTRRTSVEIFICKVLSIIFKNELHFNKPAATVSVNRLKTFMCTPDACATNSKLVLAFTNVATALVSHYSGINWLVDAKIWQLVLCACTYTRPVEVTRAAYRFIAQLVWKINELEYEPVLTEIFEFIINPIIHNRYHTTKNIIDGNEEHIYAPMMSYLNALLVLLSDTNNVIKNNKIVPLLTNYFNLELQMQFMLNVTRDSFLASVLCELLFKFYFAAVKEAYYKFKKTDSEIMNEIITLYNNVIQILIEKQMSEAVANYVVGCNLFLAKLGVAARTLIFERDGRTFEFQNQFVLHLVVPLWTYYAINCRSEIKLEAIGNYSVKLINITAEHIAKSAKIFQTVVKNHSCDVNKITIHTVKSIFQFRGQLNKAQAGVLYQALFYVLKTFVISDDVDAHLLLNENPLKTCEDVKLLILVLDAIKMLLKEHDINWYENLEIICLQETLLNLVKQKCLCTKTLVLALDLIDIGVQKFLSPDMALLVENKNESSLAEIGAITKEYMQHEDWEVRDSALSLLLSCTQLSFVKYVPFQELISENNLMPMAARCALSDPEAYAQTTALKCLAAATKIVRIWREVVQTHPNLHNHLIKMAQMNIDDFVLKESVNVLTGIFVHQNVTSEYRNNMFKLMTRVSLKELNWEVQMAALNFWKRVIAQQSLYLGMIDGKFPSVTFSKEKRKIVILNDTEIKNQLDKLMNYLSNIGCLTVLDECLNGEHNVAVIEEAYKIVTDLKLILDYYNYEAVESKTITNNPTGAKTVKMDVSHDKTNEHVISEETFTIRDIVIDNIVSTSQNDLINEIFNRSPEVPITESEAEEYIIDLIQPSEFLQKINATDYATIINNKNTWITDRKDLDELIDEVLNEERLMDQNYFYNCDI